MPGLDHLVPFVIATLAFAYFPGPALLYTAAQTMAGGRRAGFQAAIGIHIGCYAHIFAAALGLSAIFRYTPEAYTGLKLAGALYLIWIGMGVLREATGFASAEPRSAQSSSGRRAFMQSILIELLNPKVALFFLAFLPQFVDPQAALPIPLQFLVLGIIVNLTFSSADILAVLLTDKLIRFARGSMYRLRAIRICGGSIMVGLGIKLALTKT